MPPTQHRRHRPPGVVLFVLALLAAACGGEARTDSAPPDSIESTEATGRDAVQPDPEPEGTDDEPVQPEAPDSVEDAVDLPPVVGPAQTIPIVQTFETDAFRLASIGNDIVTLGPNRATLIDVDSGEMRVIELTSDLLKLEPIGLATNDTHVLVGASRTTFSEGEIWVLDPADGSVRQAESASPGAAYVLNRSTQGPSRSLVSDGPALRVVDTSTLTLDPDIVLENPTALTPDWLPDEYWLYDSQGAGSVETISTGEVRTFDLDRPLAAFVSGFAGHTDEMVWISDDTDGRLIGVDRQTLTVVAEVSLSEEFGGVPVQVVEREGGYLTARVQSDGDWYVLVRFDLGTGEILARHVVATAESGYWATSTDGPALTVLGERVFVRDHFRRIVEVDVDALGTDTGGWVAPAIPARTPLDDDGDAIAELALAWGRAEVVPADDPDQLQASMVALAGYNEEPVTWGAISVFGDRAHVWLQAGTQAVPMLVFERVEGSWRLVAESACWVAATAIGANPCAP